MPNGCVIGQATRTGDAGARDLEVLLSAGAGARDAPPGDAHHAPKKVLRGARHNRLAS